MLLILLLIIVVLVVKSVKVVQQSHAYVVERMGSYHQTWNNGVHFKIPFVDRIVNKLSLKEQVMELEPQSVITKDNVSMQIDTVMTIQVTDPKAATYGVNDLNSALEKSVGTALRNVIGEIDLDQTLSERDVINGKMQKYMDEVTDKWGVKVNRVELKNIIPPQKIQDTMERQMTAERDRRAKVTEAKGNKESQILNAEAQAETAQKEAEGAAQAKITEANAQAQSIEIEANAKAKAIKTVQAAYAESIKELDDNGTVDSFLKLQAFDTLTKVANGNATKLIVPSNLQDLTTFTTMLNQKKN